MSCGFCFFWAYIFCKEKAIQKITTIEINIIPKTKYIRANLLCFLFWEKNRNTNIIPQTTKNKVIGIGILLLYRFRIKTFLHIHYNKIIEIRV